METLTGPTKLDDVAVFVYTGKSVIDHALSGYPTIQVLASEQVDSGWRLVFEGWPEEVTSLLLELTFMGVDWSEE